MDMTWLADKELQMERLQEKFSPLSTKQNLGWNEKR
jgi:hypothetical protein